MPSPLSVDLRERVVSAVAAGASCHQAAARFGVSVSSASRWSDRFRQEGQLETRKNRVISGEAGCPDDVEVAGRAKGHRSERFLRCPALIPPVLPTCRQSQPAVSRRSWKISRLKL